jgi:acyl-coenzyme A thioesterase PaaI-like protein
MWNEDSFERVLPVARYANEKHVIHGTLKGDTMLQAYEVYKPKDRAVPIDDGSELNILVLVAKVDFGSHLNGHGGLVHGGIMGLMFDDLTGWGCDQILPVTKIPVTANLSVNYRAPCKAGSKVRIEAILEKWDGRKLFWKARMVGDNDESNEIVYAEATALYIILKDKK